MRHRIFIPASFLLAMIPVGCTQEQGSRADAAVTADSTRDAAPARDAPIPDASPLNSSCSLTEQNCQDETVCMNVDSSNGQPTCYPAECDHVRQDCGGGFICTWGYPDSRPQCFSDINASIQEGGACGTSAEQCQAGLECAGTPGSCFQMCYSNDDCSGGTQCNGVRSYNGDPINVRIYLSHAAVI